MTLLVYRDETGTLIAEGTDEEIEQAHREVQRRIDALVPLIMAVPASRPVPSLRIAAGDIEDAPRYGECACCGDPMAAHRGGMCWLCCSALPKALRQVGRI